MATPRILILRAPGTNCDEETAHAFSLAGGLPDRWHVNRLLEEPARIADFQIVCIPGGFSYGDDLGAGRILGNQIRHHLAETLAEFREAGKLILGICNGFQTLLQSGLLMDAEERGPSATLTWNDSGRFEDRWVRLGVEGTGCPFLAGIEELELPIAHAEGKLVTRDEASFTRLEQSGQLVLRYRAKQKGSQEVPYPDNPNGSIGNVAGLCDTTGRVLGLMPHPERFLDRTAHPQWTRGNLEDRDMGDGLRLFQNGVQYFL